MKYLTWFFHYGLAGFLLLLFFLAEGQPFVDPLQIRFTHGFRNGNAAATPHTHFWVGSDLPIKLLDRTYLLFSPYYENWHIDSAGKNDVVPAAQSLAFPVGIIFPLSQKWSLNLLPVIRWNGVEIFGDKTFQFGGAAFTTLKVKPERNLRFGVYMNSEFFGLFVVPLVGADWRINEKNYVFGLLPGRLTFEHKWSEKIYGGATFRALTNSFRLKNGNYMRLDDNQISLFVDYYVAKRFVLTLEPGYGLFRKIRTGLDNKNYITQRNWGDGPFIKLSTSYRIRL